MMIRKMLFIFFISLALIFPGYSQNGDIQSQIRKLIEEVKKAPSSEKYKKMNQLKLFVKRLKAEERIKIMKMLHRKLNTSKEKGMMRQHRFHGKHKNMPHREHMEMRNIKDKHQKKMGNGMHMEKRREDKPNMHMRDDGRWGSGENHGGHRMQER